MHDRMFVDYDGLRYAVTATVDDEADEVYDVSVWRLHPTRGVEPLFSRFTPQAAKTKLQHKALDVVEAAYGLCTVLEYS